MKLENCIIANQVKKKLIFKNYSRIFVTQILKSETSIEILNRSK